MDDTELVERIHKGLEGIAFEPEAFMNQHNLTKGNILLATDTYVINCALRLANEPGELFDVILQTLAASSFSTGFLLGYQIAKEKNGNT